MTRETIQLTGHIDVSLIDKVTGEVVDCVEVDNQITEPFTRWLLAGNLCASGSLNTAGNPISRFLFSGPYLKTTAPNAGNTSLAQGYQVVRPSCSGDFNLYVLSQPVNVSAWTVIPPYADSSFTGINRDETNGEPLVLFYGGADSRGDGLMAMEPVRELSYWSPVGSAPLFRTTYTRDAGFGTIRSIALGTALPNAISIQESLSELPEGWDTLWRKKWKENRDELTPNATDGRYLIAPFLRSSLIDGRVGMGLYAVGDTEDIISFYDWGTSLFEANETSDLRVNSVTGETYTTEADLLAPSRVMGGFAIGNAKSLRVDRGRAIFNENGVCVGRTVIIHYAETLSATASPTARYFETETLLATDGNIIPETIYLNNAPVMVAKSGVNSEEEDKIELFLALGVGTFVEYTDEDGNIHPGGTGIEIHKITLYCYLYRSTAARLDIVLAENPSMLVYHGRVAVLPYAIGRIAENPSAEIDETTSGENYQVGSYDSVYDEYYFPITHLLRGASPLSWEYNATKENALSPIIGASLTFQPGVVLRGLGLEFIRDTILGLGSVKTAMMPTADGYVPLTVNQRQRNQFLAGALLSAANLPVPIVKEENQRLVVSYSYSFQVVSEKPPAPDFTAETLSPTSITLRISNTVSGCMIQMHRSVTDDFTEWSPVGPHGILAVGILMFSDDNLLPDTHYYYRFRLWDGAQFGNYAYADAITGISP